MKDHFLMCENLVEVKLSSSTISNRQGDLIQSDFSLILCSSPLQISRKLLQSGKEDDFYV